MNACIRIFKEQIDLINQLKEKERAMVLYHAINDCFNQIENQIENQIDFSDLGKVVYKLLRKNIILKEFSSNYGGARKGAGRPISAENNQNKNQNDIQIENQNESAYISVSDSVSSINNSSISTTRAKEENKARVHNALEVFGNAFRTTDAVVGIFDRPDGTQREGIQIKNPRLMAFVRHRFDKRTLEKVSDWAIDHNQRGHTYNASALLKLMCKFQSNIEPAINYNGVQAEYLTFEYQEPKRKEA